MGERKSKTSCVCSAGSKEDLEQMINEHFYSTNYFINDDMMVENKKTGKIMDCWTVKVTTSGRWQVRRIA